MPSAQGHVASPFQLCVVLVRLQIGLKALYKGAQGRVVLYFGNKSDQVSVDKLQSNLVPTLVRVHRPMPLQFAVYRTSSARTHIPREARQCQSLPKYEA